MFWRVVGRTAFQYNEDEGCLFYQRQALKLMIPILQRMSHSTLDWIAHIYDMVMYIKGVSPHTKSFE